MTRAATAEILSLCLARLFSEIKELACMLESNRTASSYATPLNPISHP